MTPLAPQEEELLWQLCSPETLEDANFHGPVFGKACTPSLPSQRCVYAHQFSHLLCGMLREGQLGKRTVSSLSQFCGGGTFPSGL